MSFMDIYFFAGHWESCKASGGSLCSSTGAQTIGRWINAPRKCVAGPCKSSGILLTAPWIFVLQSKQSLANFLLIQSIADILTPSAAVLYNSFVQSQALAHNDSQIFNFLTWL
ncbi:hypothetical protein [Desulfoferrobacter suflitae]|uniref:hypothetical protein n=1 Tax=Desulfoferrobacter suflitae TaxID=2865782 RepID=UPI0021649FDD|nr:hypothetical protein [Desulfoferrobacter suflitae]MCK8602918.1 hypothetical protein [Desulfoferrobacter suflitae]